jgi:cytochrome c-type biogenesis protein CcmE
MAEAVKLNWEKANSQPLSAAMARVKRFKFVLVSIALVAIVGFLLITGTLSNQQYFITVNALLARPNLVGQTVRVTGAVIGSTIHDDQNTHTFSFTMANLNDDPAYLDKTGGLAKALHLAVTDTTAQHLNVVVADQPMPDLLQNEAQAILTGQFGADGLFHADEVLLKCPSRYQSDVPKQAAQASNS